MLNVSSASVVSGGIDHPEMYRFVDGSNFSTTSAVFWRALFAGSPQHWAGALMIFSGVTVSIRSPVSTGRASYGC
jgi:hypothetical protein